MLIILITLSFAVGAVPVAIFLHTSQIFAYFTVASALIAFVTVRERTTVATEPPSALEFVLAGVSSLLYSSLMTGFSLLMYAVGFWAVKAIAAIDIANFNGTRVGWFVALRFGLASMFHASYEVIFDLVG